MLEGPYITERQPVPYADYPFLFGGQELPAEYQIVHAANKEFVESLLPPDPNEGYTNLDRLALETMANILTATDHRLGRNVGELGTMYHKDEDGPWLTLPTFYHDGDGTRLAMRGTQEYMDFVNHREGDVSPYRARETYVKTLMAAVCDDLVFGKYGRGEDEHQSAALARAYLLMQGFKPDFVEDVVIAIKASIFDEKKFTQSYNPSLGAEAEQRGSLDGDLRDTGGRRGPAKTFMLLPENFWKRDMVGKHGQRLRGAALGELMNLPGGWHGESLFDFFTLAQRHEHIVREFGMELANNKNFILLGHRYIDPRLNELLLPAKKQSAILQEQLGIKIATGAMTILQGFHCALSYAALRPGYPRRGEPAALPPTITPEQISEILLQPDPIPVEASARNVVNARTFFKRYLAETNVGHLAVN